MSKELKALKTLFTSWDYKEVVEARKTVERALIKARKQEKENKVLKACIKDWKAIYEHLENVFRNDEKVIKIIKNKYVDFNILTDSETLDEYNSKMDWSCRRLTQEEFDTLKEMLSNG